MTSGLYICATIVYLLTLIKKSWLNVVRNKDEQESDNEMSHEYK